MYRYCLEKFDVGHSRGSKGGALVRAARVQILVLMPLCGLSLLLVLSLAARGFSPGIPVFPSP